jgi:ribosomal protein S26
MSKIVAWLILIFVVLFALRMIGMRNSRQRRAQASPTDKVGAPMVRCVRCGVFLPRAEAAEVSGGYACADEHCAQH